MSMMSVHQSNHQIWCLLCKSTNQIMKQDATNQIGCYILHQCEIIPVSFVPGFLLSRCLLLLLFHWTVVSEIVIWNKCLLIQQCTVYEFERIYVSTGTCIKDINKLFSNEHDIVKSRCSAGIPGYSKYFIYFKSKRLF